MKRLHDLAKPALIGALIPHLTWRHHGIGVLQAYVREAREPEIRIHLWHPRLVREGIVGQGDAHDHRFDLVSTVVHGRLYETLYERTESLGADRFDAWHVENARSASDRGFDGDCRPVESAIPMVTRSRVHPAGTTYDLPRGRFHRTQVDGLAITLCSMHEKRGQARLLVPHGTEPVHAFNAHHASLSATHETMAAVVEEALAALR